MTIHARRFSSMQIYSLQVVVANRKRAQVTAHRDEQFRSGIDRTSCRVVTHDGDAAVPPFVRFFFLSTPAGKVGRQKGDYRVPLSIARSINPLPPPPVGATRFPPFSDRGASRHGNEDLATCRFRANSKCSLTLRFPSSDRVGGSWAHRYLVYRNS